MPALKKIEEFAHAQADRCVMCGLCLPDCPTYLKTGDENESPRGRIALMRALVQGQLPLSKRLESHLDLCLACRACEKVCPSNVGYGEIIESGREIIAANHPLIWYKRWWRAFLFKGLIGHPLRLLALGNFLRLYQKSGIQRLSRKLGLLKPLGLTRLEAMLPPLAPHKPWKTYYPARTTPRGKVALFIGCVAPMLDQETLQAARHVLQYLDFEVYIPKDQTCCGALAWHAGDPDTGKSCMQRNLAAFSNLENHLGQSIQAILTTASGCGGMLHDYSRHSSNTTQAMPFAAHIQDISTFIAQVWPQKLALQALPKKIVVHDPCTLRNVLQDTQSPYSLLNRIPQAQVTALPENALCCGGAGAYAWTQPHMADALRADKIRHLQQLKPDILVSSNIGCALHIAAGLRALNINIEVLHPISLIARQLPE